MSCKFEDKCYNSGDECIQCMYDSSGTALDYFEFCGDGKEPTQEELDSQFEKVVFEEDPVCSLEDICDNSGNECERCMRNLYSITMDYFEFNGQGEEPTQEELDESIE